MFGRQYSENTGYLVGFMMQGNAQRRDYRASHFGLRSSCMVWSVSWAYVGILPNL